MSFGELLSALLGWLGSFVDFVFSFVPRMLIVQANERGVRYVRGLTPREIQPGVTWYWKWCSTIAVHHVVRCVLPVQPITVETSDGVTVCVGAVLVYHIADVVVFDAENFNAEENLVEAAGGCLRDVVSSLKWDQLRGDASEGTRLAGILKRRMQAPLERFGIELESCRPNDLARVPHVVRLFGQVPAGHSGIDHP